MIGTISALLRGSPSVDYHRPQSLPTIPRKKEIRQIASGEFRGVDWNEGVLHIALGNQGAITMSYTSKGDDVYRTYFFPGRIGERPTVVKKIEKYSSVSKERYKVKPDHWQNTQAHIDAKVNKEMTRCLDVFELEQRLPPTVRRNIMNCFRNGERG